MSIPRRRTSPARTIALVGLMAATVECGKLALVFLPNVEIVTILIALYGYVFGVSGIMAAVVFVCIEPLIYGFGTWVIAYFIHWPAVALAFMILSKLRIKNRWILTAVAVVITAWFGVLSSLIDVGLFSGTYEKFWYRFGIYYARGIAFYLTQIICNAVLFPLLFTYLSVKLEKIKKQFE